MCNLSFEEVTLPGKGRCLVAVRKIKALEIILTDSPAVIAPNLGSQAPVCCMCLRKYETGVQCRECGFSFCDEECATCEDHQTECRYLAKLSGQPSAVASLDVRLAILPVVRLLIVKKHEHQAWTNSIEKLMSHSEERKQSLSEWKVFRQNIVNPIMECLSEDLEVTEDDVETAIGQLNVNCASFRFPSEECEGRGLYPILSLISHSCVSNARYQVNPEDGFSVVLRAKTDIYEGEEISIQYVPSSLGQPQRQMELANEWYFHCECPRCSDTSEFGTFVSALKCCECSEGLILPESTQPNATWRCRFCNAPFGADMIRNTIETAESQLREIASNPSVKQYESWIRRNLRSFHMKHYLILLAQRQIIELLARETKVTKEGCNKIIKNCKSYLSVMTRLDPGFSSWKGSILKHQNFAQLQLLKLQLEDQSIDRNEFSMRSEEVWKSMKDVDSCDILCSKHFLRKT